MVPCCLMIHNRAQTKNLYKSDHSPSFKCCWIDIDSFAEDFLSHNKITKFVIHCTLRKTNESNSFTYEGGKFLEKLWSSVGEKV